MMKGDLRKYVLSDLRIAGSLYALLVGLCFLLLFMSRSGEVHTIWEVMHPAFIPTFFATTFLLLVMILSSVKVKYKMMFIIIHSILLHSFFVIVLPAGDAGGQQLGLGITRLTFDNVILHGWSEGDVSNILLQIYQACRGINFQTALSVIFARMLGVDVYLSHLFLVPILWGTFIPIAAFKITKALGRSDRISVLSALLVSSFPYTVYWGAISVPNSLGFIFFFYSVFFVVKYLSSNGSYSIFLILASSLVSFLAHFLAGVISFSLLLLAIALRTYEKEKNTSPTAARASLLVSFIVCTSLLPAFLIYNNLFQPGLTYFGLDKLDGLSTLETIQLFLLGESIYFDIRFALLMSIGPLLGLLCMVYILRRTDTISNKKLPMCTSFFFLGLLMILVDYRILTLFIVDLPFSEQRLWLFRDFLAVPFVAIAVGGLLAFLHRRESNSLGKIRLPFRSVASAHVNSKSFAACVLVLLSLSGWVTASVYYSYPHYAPLQVTSYELEAVKYVDENTSERYIVICDPWIIFAGQMIVGIYNPNAFYFTHKNSTGAELFLEMKENPSRSVMAEATKINNATVAYWILSEPRMETGEYDRVIHQARQNNIQTYKIFYHPENEEKLRIFYYRKP